MTKVKKLILQIQEEADETSLETLPHLVKEDGRWTKSWSKIWTFIVNVQLFVCVCVQIKGKWYYFTLTTLLAVSLVRNAFGGKCFYCGKTLVRLTFTRLKKLTIFALMS